MNKKLTEKLFTDFPNLYQNRFEPNSSMKFFSCGNGWFQIIWDLSKELAKYTELQAVQVKQKFCQLCFYWQYNGIRFNQTTDNAKQIEQYIEHAENMCDITCENCGIQDEGLAGPNSGRNHCNNCKDLSWRDLDE